MRGIRARIVPRRVVELVVHLEVGANGDAEPGPAKLTYEGFGSCNETFLVFSQVPFSIAALHASIGEERLRYEGARPTACSLGKADQRADAQALAAFGQRG